MTDAVTAAIVVAGGRGRRLGGVDKCVLVVAGAALVDHVYAAVRGCDPVVAIGPDSLARPGVRVVREDPPWAGPAAAVAAGVAALASGRGTETSPAQTWLLACDLPRAGELVDLLRRTPIPPGADGVVAVDAAGRLQWLAGRYRLEALRRAVRDLPEPQDASLRRLLGRLRLEAVPVGDAAVDLDTWEAIAQFRRDVDEQA